MQPTEEQTVGAATANTEAGQSDLLMEAFFGHAQHAPTRPFLRYFDLTLSYGATAHWVDSLASSLQRLGVEQGDRVGILLQNQPEFVLAMLACWRLNATIVPINVMLKDQELQFVLRDSGAKAVICLAELESALVLPAARAAGASIVISVVDGTFGSDGQLVAPDVSERLGRPDDGISRFSIAGVLHSGREGAVVPSWPGARDVASLTYTSGTTGPPKGAMNTHGSFHFGAISYLHFAQMSADDSVMGGSPLFSITGLVANISTAIVCGAPLVLSYRFDVSRVAETIATNRCTFTAMPIAAYGSLLRGGAAEYDLSSLTKAYGGGAAVSPRRVADFKAATGVYIHNVYGLTEAAGATHVVPFDVEAPVDQETQCLSAGFPLAHTRSQIVDDNGDPLPIGETGEILVAGPHVMAGYWERDDATAHAFNGPFLRTGDLGKVDGDGWYYIVGRAKDLINTSSWKVWPREVEEILITHPAVFEAAVVGIPDEQRGEVVRGYVSLRSGTEVEPNQLIAHCKARLAAYKCPREVVVIDDMPKTPSGKIVKHALPR